MKKRVISFLLLLVVAFIFGCDDPSSASDTSEKKQKSTEVAAKEEKGSGTIGTEGGKVKAGSAVTIKIPAEALKKDTKISVKYYEDNPSDSPSSLFLGEVEFGPSGTKFKKPAEVTMKLSRTPKNSTVSVFNYDEKNDIWDYVTEAEVSGNTVKFKVEHFSKYRTVDITPSVLNKYIDIVKAAKKDKKSDSHITQSYADYLEDDVKVMDSYVEQNDHLYKACGFRIDGAYFINGEEGNPNKLSKQFGKSNKKGDKYGLSKIGSLLYSYADYVKKADGEKESQDCISITVIIDYEPVDAYKISGHVEENLEFDIDGFEGLSESVGLEGATITMKSKGLIKLKVEYDFQGVLQKSDKKTTGLLKFTNADASFSTNKLDMSIKQNVDGGYIRIDVLVNLFESFSIKKMNTLDYNVNAVLSGSNCNLKISDISDNIISIDGLMRFKIDQFFSSDIQHLDENYLNETTNNILSVSIKDDSPLLVFELKEGTKTYTSSKFKDNYFIGVDNGTESPDNLLDHIKTSNYKTSTKQTITIELMTDEK